MEPTKEDAEHRKDNHSGMAIALCEWGIEWRNRISSTRVHGACSDDSKDGSETRNKSVKKGRRKMRVKKIAQEIGCANRIGGWPSKITLNHLPIVMEDVIVAELAESKNNWCRDKAVGVGRRHRSWFRLMI